MLDRLSEAPAATGCWARPSTTPPARPTTRWPAIWGSAIPAVPPSTSWLRRGRPRAPSRCPRSMLADGLDFSFSGLKTAVVRSDREARRRRPGRRGRLLPGGGRRPADHANFVAPWRPSRRGRWPSAGGVAANSALRAGVIRWPREFGVVVHLPSMTMCTDNAAMIAAAGIYRLRSERAESAGLVRPPQLAAGGRLMSPLWAPLDLADCDPSPFAQFDEVVRRGEGPHGRARGDRARHATPDGHPSAAHGAAAPRRRALLRLVLQLPVAQGPRPPGEPERRAALVLRAARSPDPHRGPRRAHERRRNPTPTSRPARAATGLGAREPSEPAAASVATNSRSACSTSTAPSRAVTCPARPLGRVPARRPPLRVLAAPRGPPARPDLLRPAPGGGLARRRRGPALSRRRA